jgi:hypothetical protein
MSQNQDHNRQPKGIPVGGQFAHKINSEATLDLAGEVGSNEPTNFMNERVEALRQHGYLPATTAPMLVDPRSSAHRKEWWDQHMAAGEYNNPEGGYAQMPDDWTPSRTEGRSAISGLRRTHRMAYVGNDVAIRMPSATSIKDFAATSVTGKAAGETFDVPVAAQFPGGQIDGWVRVAKGADGTWATEGLGFTPEQSAYVAESVQCVLESRRPSRALREAGDILERRRGRAAQLGAPVAPIASTWIKEAGYDKATGTMVITTEGKTGKKIYGYDVPIAAYLRVANSEAPGRVFNQTIRGKTTTVSVKDCGECGRVYVTSKKHRCPVKASTRASYIPRLGAVRDYLERRR